MLPIFTQDTDNLALSESTPVGQIVYTLQGSDPEGLPVGSLRQISFVLYWFMSIASVLITVG